MNVSRLLIGRVAAVLAIDGTIDSMLYENRAKVGPFDDRVYSAKAELPEGVVREVLPRILVHVMETPFDTEQNSADGVKPYNNCAIFINVISEADQEDLGWRLQNRCREVLVSTPLTDASIIVSEFVWFGTRDPDREEAFRNAWRFSQEFRAQAGVL